MTCASVKHHLFRLGTLVLVAACACAEATPDVSALLLAKTEAFSDASQRGDGPLLGAMLDDRVIFFNEGGDQATKADMASSKPTPQDGVTTKMTVTDWHCEVHGDVAVASFIDDQQQSFHGQPFHARYRSVETWIRAGSDWQMIGSETIALQDDPVAITIPPSALDAYVGSYEAAPDVRFVFSRSGSELVASANGGPATVQKAASSDVFFTPGHARITKVFQRDANGRISGFLLRREGHDIRFRRV